MALVRFSEELREQLAQREGPVQVLIKLRPSGAAVPSVGTSRVEAYAARRRKADLSKSSLLEALQKESALDTSVNYQPVGVFDSVSLIAPPEVIERIASHPDVSDIVLDEPTDVLEFDVD